MPFSPSPLFIDACLRGAIDTDATGLLLLGPDVAARRGPTVRYANAAFGTLTGQPLASLVGRPLSDALGLSEVAPDYGPLFPVLTALRAGERIRTDLQLERPDGSAYCACLYLAPLRAPGTDETYWTVRLSDVTERVQAERTLRVSEERFRSLMTGHPGIVYRCSYDAAWSTLFMSDAFEEVCGWPSADFVAARRSFRSLIVEDDLPAIREAVRLGIDRRQPYEVEYRIRRPDGDVRWLYDKGRAAFGEDGRVLHLDGVMLDVTERRLAEERLRLLETAVADTTDSLLITDADFEGGGPHIVYVNRGFERMSGYAAREVLGRTPRLLHGEATDRSVTRRLRRELAGGDRFFGSTINYKKDGTPFDIEWSVSAVVDEAGQTTHYVAVQRDVTERQRTEQQLRLLRTAIESTQDAIVLARPSGPERQLQPDGPDRADGAALPAGLTILYANPAFADLTHLSAEALAGSDALDLIESETADLLEMARSGAAHTLEVRLRDNTAPFELALAPLERAHLAAPPTGAAALFGSDAPADDWLVLTLRDLSDTRRAEAEAEARARAEEMARLKGALLANMSHEIRTPLTAIIGFAQILAEETDGEATDFAQRIVQSGERLKATLSSVLDLAQLEAGALEVRAHRVDLCTFVSQTAMLLAPLAESKALGFEVELPDHPVVAVLDERHLTRILQNLIGNAAKFTDVGELRVSVQEAEGHALIAVADTGVGISEAFRERLFEEFQQESTGIGRAYEGNGLGLCLTRRLTELMGGTISVQSIVGAGSTFTVRFPLVPTILASGDGLSAPSPDHLALRPSGRQALPST